jgi:hypothetical protein
MTRKEFEMKYSNPRWLGGSLNVQFNGIVTTFSWTDEAIFPRLFIYRFQFDAIVAYRQEFYRDWETVMRCLADETPEQKAISTEFDPCFKENYWEALA